MNLDELNVSREASNSLTNSGNQAPIGIFDSGIGGLSVVRHIQRELPAERLLYIADSAHAPYGFKSADAIKKRATKLSSLLIQRRIKLLVIACNTATAAAVGRLRSLYTIPVIGMEPALKPAATMTLSGVVGILATSATLNSDKFRRLCARFGQNVKVATQPCPGLVEQIEAGDLTGAKTRQLVERFVGDLLDLGADTLVLGCTHYPFLRPLIEEVAGPDVQILDTGIAVTNEIRRRLIAEKLLAEEDQRGHLEIWSSGDVESTRAIATRLWGNPLTVRSLNEIDSQGQSDTT